MLYRPFAWRTERDLFWALVAEILLAKTPARRVEPVWLELRQRFRNASGIAGASVETLEKTLRPLGLQRRRARQILGLAQHWTGLRVGSRRPQPVVSEAPPGYGTGEYAKAAFSTFYLGIPRLIVDANVRRVFCRYLGRSEFNATVMGFAKRALPEEPDRARRYSYALLDLAGTVCTPRRPGCGICPVRRGCEWRERQ